MNSSTILAALDGKSGWHSAIMSSYTANAAFFECHLFGQLARREVVSINLLIDRRCFEAAIGPTTAGCRYTGQRYAVDTIEAKGAFHPKITLVTGDDKAMLAVGSGNLTAAGQGRNIEAFCSVVAESPEDEAWPLIAEAWHYLQSFSEQMSGYTRRRICTDMAKNCRPLGEASPTHHSYVSIADSTEAALLYNEADGALFDQLAALVDEKIKHITVVSPFYDASGALLEHLWKHFAPEEGMDVVFASASYNTEDDMPFFPHGIKRPERFGWHILHKTEENKKTLHAKVFIFRGVQHDYMLCGSANATMPGFGLSPAGTQTNHEMSMLLRVPTGTRDFAEELGLELVRADFHSVKASSAPTVDNGNVSYGSFLDCLTEVSLTGKQLKVCLRELACTDTELILLDDFAKEVLSLPVGADGTALLPPELNSRQVCLARLKLDDELYSNTVVVQHSVQLEATYPSVANRLFNKLLAELEPDKPNIAAIAECINQIFLDAGRKEAQVIPGTGTSYAHACDFAPSVHQKGSHIGRAINEALSSIANRLSEEEALSEEAPASTKTEASKSVASLQIENMYLTIPLRLLKKARQVLTILHERSQDDDVCKASAYACGVLYVCHCHLPKLDAEERKKLFTPLWALCEALGKVCCSGRVYRRPELLPVLIAMLDATMEHRSGEDRQHDIEYLSKTLANILHGCMGALPLSEKELSNIAWHTPRQKRLFTAIYERATAQKLRWHDKYGYRKGS